MTIDSGKPLMSGASSSPLDVGPTVNGASRLSAASRASRRERARSAGSGGTIGDDRSIAVTSSMVRSNTSSGRSRLPARERRRPAASPTRPQHRDGKPDRRGLVALAHREGPPRRFEAGVRLGGVTERLEEVLLGLGSPCAFVLVGARPVGEQLVQQPVGSLGHGRVGDLVPHRAEAVGVEVVVDRAPHLRRDRPHLVERGRRVERLTTGGPVDELDDPRLVPPLAPCSRRRGR